MSYVDVLRSFVLRNCGIGFGLRSVYMYFTSTSSTSSRVGLAYVIACRRAGCDDSGAKRHINHRPHNLHGVRVSRQQRRGADVQEIDRNRRPPAGERKKRVSVYVV